MKIIRENHKREYGNKIAESEAEDFRCGIDSYDRRGFNRGLVLTTDYKDGVVVVRLTGEETKELQKYLNLQLKKSEGVTSEEKEELYRLCIFDNCEQVARDLHMF